MSLETRLAIVETCKGITYQTIHHGLQKNGESWEHDKFTVIFGGIAFDYSQGVGHSCLIYTKSAKYGSEKIKGLTFKRDSEKAGYTVFSDSSRYIKRPHLADFLYSVLMDSSLAGESFSDFCANCGYDTDSRKALEIYLKCQENGEKLRKVLTNSKWQQCQEILQDY